VQLSDAIRVCLIDDGGPSTQADVDRMTDAARFEAFVREYQDMVFAVAVRLLANPVEAEDVAQTVFLKAFEHFDDVAGNPAAGGWLKTVATNLCLNHLSRYRSRWRFFSELGQDAADESDSVERLLPGARVEPPDMDASEAHERLERALRALPDRQRVPLVLFHFEDMSYQEIAALLNVSLAKIKTDIHRGRDALRRVLTAESRTGARVEHGAR
jgi:RNA polymerase sigma-70 factor (ECF subfamily)